MAEVQDLLDVDAGSTALLLLLREHHFDRASETSFIVKSMSEDLFGATATIEIDSGDKPTILRVREGTSILVEADGMVHRFRAVQANSVGVVLERGPVARAKRRTDDKAD
ncbi:MAG: hypothetical protein AMXMBFR58_38980 [Phycisphaerae bacterium]